MSCRLVILAFIVYITLVRGVKALFSCLILKVLYCRQKRSIINNEVSIIQIDLWPIRVQIVHHMIEH